MEPSGRVGDFFLARAYIYKSRARAHARKERAGRAKQEAYLGGPTQKQTSLNRLKSLHRGRKENDIELFFSSFAIVSGNTRAGDITRVYKKGSVMKCDEM